MTAAEAQVAERGLAGLRMQPIADVVGGSRQANVDGGFVRQFVGESPVIDRAQARLTPVFQAKWPGLDTAQLDIAIEAAVRLTISHFLLPLHTPAEAAAQNARILANATPADAGTRSASAS